MRMKNTYDRKFGLPQFLPRFFSDIVAVLISWFLSFYLRFYILPGAQKSGFLFFCMLSPFVLVSALYFLSHNKLYQSDVTMTWRKEAGELFKTAFEVFVTWVLVFYFFFDDKVSRVMLSLFAVFLFLLLVVNRTIVNAAFTHEYTKGKGIRRVLLVGYGEKIEEYIRVATDDEHGLRFVGQYDGEGGWLSYPRIISSSLKDAALQVKADIVVISYPLAEYAKEKEIVGQGLDLFSQKVILLPHIPQSYAGTYISDFHYIPVLRINGAEMSFFKRIVKRVLDVISCSLGVVLLSPLFAVFAILVKATSKGPVFFKQRRVTRDGKTFNMYKFRSMRTDVPEGKAHWTEENDPRITKIGRFLRKTSLDEIPQFFNVIGGSMSLVGPRPERPELEEEFKKTIPGYAMRHRVKAGITGWAQVNGLRGNTSLEKRVEFDLFYIRNWSLWFDLKIVFMTFFKGFINKNAY
ncbi:MAG: undecaprenyl-phosphate glucose phosphotransferase [Sphaerochaetaceae bacterium]|jgi:exopolysaccharide biosynthesis polyprenyl glycosylphosphotransferase